MFVALGFQHEVPVHRTVTRGCQAVQHSCTLSLKRYDFRKGVLNIKCVF